MSFKKWLIGIFCILVFVGLSFGLFSLDHDTTQIMAGEAGSNLPILKERLNMDELVAPEYIDAIVDAAKNEGAGEINENDLIRFASLYQYEISETQRFRIEKGWLNLPPANSKDMWLRAVALTASGIPELAADYCEKIIATEDNPMLRELAIDGWLSARLKSIGTSPEEIGNWLSEASGVVRPDTLEHMMSQLLFRGPVHASRDGNRRLAMVNMGQYDITFVDAAFNLSGAAVAAEGARNAVMLYLPWRNIFDVSFQDQMEEVWKVWFTAIETSPDGPALEAALAVLPETLFYCIHRSLADTELLDNSYVFLEKMHSVVNTPHTSARLKEALSTIYSFKGDWDTAVDLRLDAADKLREPSPSAWLDSAHNWGQAMEDDSWKIYSEIGKGDTEAAKFSLVQWMRDHPYGPVTWRVYEQFVGQSCESCAPTVYESMNARVLPGEIYPPEPAWNGEVLSSAPFICGVPALLPDYTGCPEAVITRLNNMARKLSYPAKESCTIMPLSGIALAIQSGDVVSVVNELWNAFEAGYVEEDGQKLDLAAVQAVLSLDKDGIRALLAEHASLPTNPRSMALRAGIICAQSCTGDTLAQDSFNQAADEMLKYLYSLSVTPINVISPVEIQKAEAVVLAQVLLLGEKSGRLNEMTEGLSRDFLSKEKVNPYAARVLWPLALREIRHALAAGDRSSALLWLDAFENVTRTVSDSDAIFAETDIAIVYAQRLRLLITN